MIPRQKRNRPVMLQARHIFLAGSLALFPFIGAAQIASNAIPLSLEASVLMALDANPDLRVQAYGPLIAGTFLEREKARFHPELFADVAMRDIRNAQAKQETGDETEQLQILRNIDESLSTLARSNPAETSTTQDASGSDSIMNLDRDQLLVRAGINQALSTGARVSLSLEQENALVNLPDTPEEARITLSFTQALLRGAGRTVNLAAVQHARLDIDLSESELRGYIERILATTEKTYWQFWLAGETINLASQALQIAQQQLQDIQKRIAVGQLPRNQEVVALAELARRRQTLIDAKSSFAKQRVGLLALIAPDHLDTEYLPTTEPSTPEEESGTTTQDRIALAESSRSDLQEARIRLAKRQLDTVITENGRLPKLDFFAELAKVGYGETISEAWSDIDGSAYDIQAGLRLNYTPWKSADTARAQEARFRQAQAEAAVDNLSIQIAGRIRVALLELQRALQQIEASRETRTYQQQMVDAEIERFQIGAGTALLVAEAQRDLLTLLIAEKEALVQARLAILELYLAEGSLLDRRGFTALHADRTNQVQE